MNDGEVILDSVCGLKKSANPVKDYSKICGMYTEGYDIATITEQCGCSIGTVYRALKMTGMETRYHQRGILRSIVDRITEMYRQGFSVLSISKTIGCSYYKVGKIIKNSDLKPISYSKRINPNLDEDFFAEIDTAEKAYWLGWLITDGCITKGNTISLTICKKDIKILGLLQSDLGLGNKIKPFNEKYVRFSFCCKRMVEDLSKYGIVMNKTFTVELPDLDKELMPHLLRGCFEGDGGISKIHRKKTGKYEWELSFTGNKMCVDAFNRHLSALLGKAERNLNKIHSVWRVRWTSKEDIRAILNVLYKDCGEHYLERKQKFIGEI